MPLIEVHALTKAFGFAPVLKKLDLSVDRGQFVALLGHNGSGKSTLMRLLCGLSKPTSGRILIGGWEMPKEIAAIRSQIGVVSHKPLLYENLTAHENLEFFARLYNLKDAQLIERGLTRVGLAKRGDDLVRTFSRGMQQRLAIARALLHNPDVLIMDEPYTGLDQDGSNALDELLKGAYAEGRTILMSTHDLDRAEALASRAVILAKGRVAHDAAAQTPNQTLAQVYRQVTGAAVGAVVES